MLQIGEENTDLALGRGQGIAAMDQVLGEQDAKVATNGSRGGIAGIGCAHHVSHYFPSIFGAF